MLKAIEACLGPKKKKKKMETKP